MARFTVRVTPRASRERIEVSEAGIRVYVTAAPTDGEANDAVHAALAKKLKLAKGKVELVRGHTSREKEFSVDELDLAEIRQRLS